MTVVFALMEINNVAAIKGCVVCGLVVSIFLVVIDHVGEEESVHWLRGAVSEHVDLLGGLLELIHVDQLGSPGHHRLDHFGLVLVSVTIQAHFLDSVTIYIQNKVVSVAVETFWVPVYIHQDPVNP